MCNFFVHAFFFVPVKHVGFFSITFHCKIFFTHAYVLINYLLEVLMSLSCCKNAPVNRQKISHEFQEGYDFIKNTERQNRMYVWNECRKLPAPAFTQTRSKSYPWKSDIRQTQIEISVTRAKAWVEETSTIVCCLAGARNKK